MEAWLRALISSIPQPFRSAGELVIGAIIRVFQWTNSLLIRTRGNWNPLADAARWLNQGIDSLASEIYTTVKHLILTKIPQWAQWAVDNALRWAADRINEAKAIARNLFNSAIAWARDQINAARDLIGSVLKWAADRIAWLWAGVTRLLDRVFTDWASPLRLAEWLVGAMWTVLWRYAWSQRDKFVDVARGFTLTLLLRASKEIERQIARLF